MANKIFAGGWPDKSDVRKEAGIEWAARLLWVR